MRLGSFRHVLPASRWLFAAFPMVVVASTAVAAPHVEFDFARAVGCRLVTPPADGSPVTQPRLVEVTLPVSVRFHGLTREDVDELDIEIDGAAAGLRVFDFSPRTQLASDVAQQIETTTTTKRARSIDGTLGGALPVPYAELVAHVSPSINAGISGSEIATEKMNIVPPKQAVVVSGTSSEGRGAFFKFKRSSQTSLEGVHALRVIFAVPDNWHNGDVQVQCSARGQRRVIWIKQPATVGREADTVRLQLASTAPAYHVSKPVVTEDDAKSNGPVWITAIPLTEAKKPADDTERGRVVTKQAIEDGSTAGR